MAETQTVILLAREQSSMVSTWTAHLCARRLESGEIWIGECAFEPLAGVGDDGDDFVWPKGNSPPAHDDDLYDDFDFDSNLPVSINGKAVTGIEDDLYLGPDLYPNGETAKVANGEFEAALRFIRSTGWDTHPEFDRAWKVLRALIAA